MRYLSVKVLPVVAALLLWAVATPADAEWYRLRPPHRDNFIFDANAPLALWFQEMQATGHADNFTFYTEHECQKKRLEWVLRGKEAIAEVHWSREHGVRSLYDLSTATRMFEMESASQCISSDDPRLVSAPAPQPSKATQPGYTYTHEPAGIIRYTPGRPIVVTVKLNGRSSARLVLDTGADFSVVKSELLAAAGVDLTRPAARGKVIGVAGETGASYFHVIFETVGHRVQMPHVAALNTYDDDFADGLLGRDFLDRFKVVMDPAAGVVTLVPR